MGKGKNADIFRKHSLRNSRIFIGKMPILPNTIFKISWIHPENTAVTAAVGTTTAAFSTVRKCIGAGTIVNMVCVGYGADLLCWLFLDVLQISMTMPLKVGALLTGSVFAGLGVAFYMTAELGIAPYDSLAVILGKMLQGKVPFQYMRICTDVTAIIIGVLFCLASGDSLWMIIGIGTICNACLNGPLIQFFRTRVTDPMLK